MPASDTLSAMVLSPGEFVPPTHCTPVDCGIGRMEGGDLFIDVLFSAPSDTPMWPSVLMGVAKLLPSSVIIPIEILLGVALLPSRGLEAE